MNITDSGAYTPIQFLPKFGQNTGTMSTHRQTSVSCCLNRDHNIGSFVLNSHVCSASLYWEQVWTATQQHQYTTHMHSYNWTQSIHSRTLVLRHKHMHTHTHTLMICHRRPRTRWGRPSMRSEGPMLTMLQPIDDAELMASVWFSWIRNVFSFPLLIALSSTVLGTDVLISLLEKERER